MPGIDREHAVQRLGRPFAVLAVDLMLGQQDQGRRMPGIHVKGRIQRRDHRFSVAVIERLGQPVVNVRIVAESLKGFAVAFCGQLVILLGCRQCAGGEVRLAAVRVALDDPVVEVSQDKPRLDSRAAAGIGPEPPSPHWSGTPNGGNWRSCKPLRASSWPSRPGCCADRQCARPAAGKCPAASPQHLSTCAAASSYRPNASRHSVWRTCHSME